MGSHIEFRDVQKVVVELRALMQNVSPILTMISIGDGKSFLFMLPAWCNDGGVSDHCGGPIDRVGGGSNAAMSKSENPVQSRARDIGSSRSVRIR